MGIVFAFAAGYLLGARTSTEDFDDIVEALQAIRQSDEFNDLLRSLRSHAAHTLRELASMVDRSGDGTGAFSSVTTQDLVDRVKKLAGRD